MIAFTRLSLLVAVLVSAAAAFTPTRTTRDVLAEVLVPADNSSNRLAMNPAEPLSNAQRLRRGLPPNRPRARYAGRGAQAIGRRQGASPVPCVSQSGRIQVTYSPYPSGGVSLTAWLSRNTNSVAQYTVSTDVSQALSVTICPQTTTGAFDIYTTNGFANYPYLGSVVGPVGTTNDLGDSYNYNYIQAVQEVPYGPAVDGASSRSTYTQYESHIWTLGANNELLPAWVNEDGSVYPGQSLVHWNAFGLDLIFVTGNVDKFHTGSGLATDIVHFYFVPS